MAGDEKKTYKRVFGDEGAYVPYVYQDDQTTESEKSSSRTEKEERLAAERLKRLADTTTMSMTINGMNSNGQNNIDDDLESKDDNPTLNETLGQNNNQIRLLSKDSLKLLNEIYQERKAKKLPIKILFGQTKKQKKIKSYRNCAVERKGNSVIYTYTPCDKVSKPTKNVTTTAVGLTQTGNALTATVQTALKEGKSLKYAGELYKQYALMANALINQSLVQVAIKHPAKKGTDSSTLSISPLSLHISDIPAGHAKKLKEYFGENWLHTMISQAYEDTMENFNKVEQGVIPPIPLSITTEENEYYAGTNDGTWEFLPSDKVTSSHDAQIPHDTTDIQNGQEGDRNTIGSPSSPSSHSSAFIPPHSDSFTPISNPTSHSDPTVHTPTYEGRPGGDDVSVHTVSSQASSHSPSHTSSPLQSPSKNPRTSSRVDENSNEGGGNEKNLAENVMADFKSRVGYNGLEKVEHQTNEAKTNRFELKFIDKPSAEAAKEKLHKLGFRIEDIKPTEENSVSFFAYLPNTEQEVNNLINQLEKNRSVKSVVGSSHGSQLEEESIDPESSSVDESVVSSSDSSQLRKEREDILELKSFSTLGSSFSSTVDKEEGSTFHAERSHPALHTERTTQHTSFEKAGMKMTTAREIIPDLSSVETDRNFQDDEISELSFGSSFDLVEAPNDDGSAESQWPMVNGESINFEVDDYNQQGQNISDHHREFNYVAPSNKKDKFVLIVDDVSTLDISSNVSKESVDNEDEYSMDGFILESESQSGIYSEIFEEEDPSTTSSTSNEPKYEIEEESYLKVYNQDESGEKEVYYTNSAKGRSEDDEKSDGSEMDEKSTEEIQRQEKSWGIVQAFKNFGSLIANGFSSDNKSKTIKSEEDSPLSTQPTSLPLPSSPVPSSPSSSTSPSLSANDISPPGYPIPPLPSSSNPSSSSSSASQTTPSSSVLPPSNEEKEEKLSKSTTLTVKSSSRHRKNVNTAKPIETVNVMLHSLANGQKPWVSAILTFTTLEQITPSDVKDMINSQIRSHNASRSAINTGQTLFGRKLIDNICPDESPRNEIDDGKDIINLGSDGRSYDIPPPNSSRL